LRPRGLERESQCQGEHRGEAGEVSATLHDVLLPNRVYGGAIELSSDWYAGI
jgi:hypothetical protein